MVLLTLTPTAKAALQEYHKALPNLDEAALKNRDYWEKLSTAEVGTPVDHHDLLTVAKYFAAQNDETSSQSQTRRLDVLLRGAAVYQPPPPQKSEPTSEYKVLMRRLRVEEEQRQYERMINPAPKTESFRQRFPGKSNTLGPFAQATAEDIDEVSFADVNRQMILIINVLISIICCSVAIWMAARRWSVPQRLGLSFSGSAIVAVAEVAIYMGYIKRIKDAKAVEAKHIEKKEILDTWIIDAKPKDSTKVVSKYISTQDMSRENVRLRKGKNR